MRIKEILFSIFLLLLLLNRGAAQEELPVSNTTVKYEIWRYSLQFIDTNNVIPSKDVIAVDISPELKRKLKAISSQQWFKWLENTHTDWAANLLLYDLYERDAIVYKVVIKSRKDWILAMKAKELEYWKTFLEKR